MWKLLVILVVIKLYVRIDILKKIAFQAEEQSKLELLSKSNAFKRVDN